MAAFLHSSSPSPPLPCSLIRISAAARGGGRRRTTEGEFQLGRDKVGGGGGGEGRLCSLSCALLIERLVRRVAASNDSGDWMTRIGRDYLVIAW